MEKILEALKSLLPSDKLNEVSNAVDEMLAEVKKDLEKEFDSKLEEAYSELSAELAQSENTAKAGYEEAYAIINDLRGRLETQREEFEKELDSGYTEAYEIILAERAKNESLSVDIHEEYDNKLNEMKEYIVDKVNEFLQFKGQEIYEQAKRDVLNDPRMAEHKVTLDKIVENVARYISNEDYTLATNCKIEEAEKAVRDLQAQVKMSEARMQKLSRDNEKLNEQVRQNQEALNESKTQEKKERTEKAKKVSGRGESVKENVAVIAETVTAPKTATTQENTNLLESIGLDRETANLLAGTKKSNSI